MNNETMTIIIDILYAVVLMTIIVACIVAMIRMGLGIYESAKRIKALKRKAKLYNIRAKVFEQEAQTIEMKHRTICDIYVHDKIDNKVHKIGMDKHDSLWVSEDGTVHYMNLQTGDGCGANSRKEFDSIYEFVPSDCGEIFEVDYDEL